jgi:mono/diheme cytochrome c family protein
MKQTTLNGVLAATLTALAAAGVPSTRADDAKTVQEGKEVYGDNCATCHGEQLRNTSHGVTFDLRTLKPSEHERFVHSVLNGKNQMPPWRDVLDAQQIDDIWAYVRATVDH